MERWVLSEGEGVCVNVDLIIIHPRQCCSRSDIKELTPHSCVIVSVIVSVSVSVSGGDHAQKISNHTVAQPRDNPRQHVRHCFPPQPP